MSFESTAKGNPEGLTIQQHFHSAHSIEKFYGSDERVDVNIFGECEIVKRHKRAKIFCTKRTWDQRAERGYMVDIETAYHEEIDTIKPFDERNHEALSKYLLLWLLRHQFHLSDNNDSELYGISGSGLSKNEEEVLERKQCMFVRDGGVVPSRFGVGLQIQIALDREWHSCEHFKWGLMEAVDGEFICADGYGGWPFIPITPKHAFLAQTYDQMITRDQLAEFNKHSVETAKEYYFARKLNDCPVAQ